MAGEPPYCWIFDEMQNTRDARVARPAAPDMDDPGVLKIGGENIDHALTGFLVDRIEDFVDEHPALSLIHI